GGFAESLDGGDTWQTKNEGLESYNYLVEISVNPTDPNTMIASVAKGAHSAHKPNTAYPVLMTREGNHPWQPRTDGLPHPAGANVLSLAAHQSEPDIFHAVNNTRIYQSRDAGKSWQKLATNGPDFLKKKRIYCMIAI